jgi:hypothetical protein
VLNFSHTEAEKRLGLGRIDVEYARDNETGLQLLITQSLHTGQYVTGSANLNSSYWDRLEQLTGEEATVE